MVLGERRNTTNPNPIPGAWLPFTSSYSTQYGRVLGDDAITRVGWGNAADMDPDVAAGFDLVVACGIFALNWCKRRGVVDRTEVMTIPHPSWLYRWGQAAEKKDNTVQSLKRAIGEVYSVT